MPLTDGDRERVRYHLGYLNVGATNNNSNSFPPPGAPGNAASLLFSIPRPVETLFILEKTMDQILEIGVPRVRALLNTLDLIEQKMIESLDRLAASKIDEITLRGTEPGLSEQDALEREYIRWSDRLADQLGTPKYPFSKRHMPGTGMTGFAGNVRVRTG